MHTHFSNISQRLFSPKLWKNFGAPEFMNPSGSSYQTPSGNQAFGFFDDFLTFNSVSLSGPWMSLLGTGCTAVLGADTATEKGVLNLSIDGNAANDEAIMKWGGLLSAPFKLANNELAFECRLAVSSITAAKFSYFLGLGQADMIVTDSMFVDTTGIMVDKNLLGFSHLSAEGAAIDGSYKASGHPYQDGAVKTKLDTLHTAVASTYVKLGFHYKPNPRTIEWYVNGSIPGGNVNPAKLTSSEIDAATFPKSAFLAPVFGIKDIAGNTALTLSVDWIACAQYE